MAGSWSSLPYETGAGLRPFPPGWLVIAALAISVGLFLAITFVTFGRLKGYSGGMEPFDGRYHVYDTTDAGALLDALGNRGRAYYAKVQLKLDAIFPAAYAIAGALALLWLAAPGRVARNGFSLALKVALVALPTATAILDWSENASIARLLVDWPNVSAELVARTSRFTTLKSLAALISETAIIALFAAHLWRRLRARRSA